MRYEIKRFMMVRTDNLILGDAAAQFASDKDDREAVAASMGDVGTIQPLLVADGASPGVYTVLDGLGRLRAAQERVDADGKPDPITELPCLLVECDDPRRLALHVNSAGRKRSTGSRVLCYLLANKGIVMEAYEATAYACPERGGSPSRDGHPPKKGNQGDVPERLRPWTVKDISKRLGVSDKDVSLALELIVCVDTMTYPSRATLGRHAPGERIEDINDEEALLKAYTGVMCGRTPVRRWAAAFAGRASNDGKGRADVDIAAVAERAATSLVTAFEGWHRAQWAGPKHLEKVERTLASALAIMPECCRLALIELIPQSWGPHEQAALVKAITQNGKR